MSLTTIHHFDASVSPSITAGNSALEPCPTAPEWYAVYTKARHEKHVARHFQTRSIQNFLPTYEVQRKWRNGCRVTLVLPLFPNYIFVHIPATDRIRVLDIPGVWFIVGGIGGKPAVLPTDEMNILRSGLVGLQAQPHPLLTAGNKCRIRSGSLVGLEGIVVRLKNYYRVVITVQSIMKSFSVEIPVEDLEVLNVV